MHTTEKVTSVLRHAAMACLVVLVFACNPGGPAATITPSAASSTPSTRPSPVPTPTLTASDREEVTQLEKRPLRIPAAPGDGSCRQGPFTPQINPYANGRLAEHDVYGAGPVFGLGGSPIHAGPYVYFDVTYFTSPGVSGAVLIRINDVSGKYAGRFVGPLATGQSLGTDTMAGQQLAVGSEVALPAGKPLGNDPPAASGWGIWHVRQGIDARFTCAAIQIDTESTTEVILGH
jgi:hypothetical protein